MHNREGINQFLYPRQKLGLEGLLFELFSLRDIPASVSHFSTLHLPFLSCTQPPPTPPRWEEWSTLEGFPLSPDVVHTSSSQVHLLLFWLLHLVKEWLYLQKISLCWLPFSSGTNVPSSVNPNTVKRLISYKVK